MLALTQKILSRRTRRVNAIVLVHEFLRVKGGASDDSYRSGSTARSSHTKHLLHLHPILRHHALRLLDGSFHPNHRVSRKVTRAALIGTLDEAGVGMIHGFPASLRPSHPHIQHHFTHAAEVVMSSASKCPFANGLIKNTSQGTSNRDSWPNQLDLQILRQHSPKSDLMNVGFSYSK